MNYRKAVTFYEEDKSITIIKPYSEEYENFLYVIHEDAYGEMVGVLTPIDELRTRLNLDVDEFDYMLKLI